MFVVFQEYCTVLHLFQYKTKQTNKQTNKTPQFLDLELNIPILSEFWDLNYLLFSPKYPSPSLGLSSVGSASLLASVISLTHFLPVSHFCF